ncbi:hypothetical protein [Neobacillus niacini]|uniref:hypothetical protein n=1 Tax=Neobacillus niacini TaxID=86668 RepID=UPI0021CB5C75|nr:hypothetical protein [Neobacillus niacini]MCM3766873.1 hypothetical protein [Neobacillus niacini]
MKKNTNILHAARLIGGSILTIGLLILSYSLFVSGSSTMTGIGIGTAIGAVFIFLMGIFFVATEEMLEKSYKGIPLTPIQAKKERPLRRSF